MSFAEYWLVPINWSDSFLKIMKYLAGMVSLLQSSGIKSSPLSETIISYIYHIHLTTAFEPEVCDAGLR